MVGKSLDEIVSLYNERKNDLGPTLDRMRQLRNAYNGEMVIPLPEMDRQEQVAVANLIANGLDQSAMRIASTTPSVYFPPVEYGNKASEKKARTRTRATMGWWETNKMELKLRQRARYLIGYASAPVVLRPDMKKGCARWDLRDPLSTYPSTPTDASDMTPDNTIFTYERKRAWVKAQYPDALFQLRSAGPERDSSYTIIEYQDADVAVIAILSNADTQSFPTSNGQPYVELERVSNRTGMSLVVAPGRISLDKPQGQFDGLIGMYQMEAKLMALNYIATEREVFPDMYLISRPNETADFLAGPYDGRTGQVNIIKGGEFRESTTNPGFAADKMLDRLERNMRVTGGIAPELGGESQSNVRTGKRGDAILSAVVDFPIQEAQEILATSLMEENRRAVAIAKSYFGNEKKSFYISSRTAKGHVDYTPNKDFETDHNIVTYPHSGSDANSLVQGIGQRVGIGTLSKQSAMEIDPMIDDPELERDRIIAEGLAQSLLASIEQQANSGAIVPADLAKIMSYVASDKMDLAEAVTKVHQEAQARQATPAPQGAPETMAGLGAPGQGAEQPTIAPPGAGSQNLAAMLASLKGRSMGAPLA